MSEIKTKRIEIQPTKGGWAHLPGELVHEVSSYLIEYPEQIAPGSGEWLERLEEVRSRLLYYDMILESIPSSLMVSVPDQTHSSYKELAVKLKPWVVFDRLFLALRKRAEITKALLLFFWLGRLPTASASQLVLYNTSTLADTSSYFSAIIDMIVDCAVSNVWPIVAPYVRVVLPLILFVVKCVFMLLVFSVAVITGIAMWCVQFLASYTALEPDVQAQLQVLFGLVVVVSFIMYRRRRKFRLNEVKLRSKGKTLASHELEMSFPDSEFFPSKKRAVGAVMVKSAGSDLRIHGVFWRYEDYLVTARHVANAIHAGEYKSYLTDMVQNRRGNWFINERKCIALDKDFFAPENNLIGMENVDLFSCKMDWKGLSIQKSTLKTRSAYGLTVNSVGYVDKLLVSATGSTKKSRVMHEMAHTASTRCGFSGSPLYCGNSVVGIHVRNENKENVAVRAEMLLYLLRRSQEEAVGSQDEVTPDFKIEGIYGLERREGREVDLESLYGIEEDYMYRTKSDGRVGFCPRIPDLGERTAAGNVRWADYDDMEEEGTPVGFSVVERKKPVNVSKHAKSEHMAKELLDMEAVQSVGYYPEQFLYPDITSEVERKSMYKHLTLFNSRRLAITKELTAIQKMKVISMAHKKLKPLSYKPHSDYKSLSNIKSIIDSSRVKEHKSSGHPWVSDNHWPLNVDVLQNIPDFEREVLKRWDDVCELKVQVKNEATKCKKIENDMPRCVVGFPVHKLVQSAAVFGPMLDATSDNWKETPVKYFWTPKKPGEIDHIAQWLGDHAIYESDKPNWDYMAFMWLIDMVREVVKSLAIRPPEWNDNQWSTYLSDVDLCIDQAFVTRLIRLSNGEVLKPDSAGIMPSGHLLTIFLNTLCMIVGDLAVKVAMDLPVSVIDKNNIVAGGDDVLQTMIDIDPKRYEEVSREIGFTTELLRHDSLDGAEFFSNKLYKDGLHWKFKPVRFSRHIVHMMHQKDENLPQHLSTIMREWLWDDKVFRIFSDAYLRGHEKNPVLFKLKDLPSLDMLRSEFFGYE